MPPSQKSSYWRYISIINIQSGQFSCSCHVCYLVVHRCIAIQYLAYLYQKKVMFPMILFVCLFYFLFLFNFFNLNEYLLYKLKGCSQNSNIKNTRLFVYLIAEIRSLYLYNHLQYRNDNLLKCLFQARKVSSHPFTWYGYRFCLKRGITLVPLGKK